MRTKTNMFTYGILTIFVVLGITVIANVNVNTNENVIQTNSEQIGNVKICWGLKRNNNHEQPDVGSVNREVLENNGGICLGNKDEKTIYITFDEGYEAGNTAKLLDTLKENDVKATFFITAHYFNSAPELVERMIQEGHIVGNHIPNSLMYRKIKYKEN